MASIEPVGRSWEESVFFAENLRRGQWAVKKAPLPLILGAVFMTCTEGAGGRLSAGDPSAPLVDPSNYVVLAVIGAVALVVLFFGWLLRSFVHTGVLRSHEAMLRTGKTSVGTVFSGADRFVAMAGLKVMKWFIPSIVVMILVSPAVCAGGALAYAPEHVPVDLVSLITFGFGGLATLVGLYVLLGFTFAEQALVFDKLGPVAALRRSWSVMSGHRLEMVLYYLLAGLVIVVMAAGGLLVCCVGVLVTLPMARAWVDVGLSEGWLLMSRPRSETERWSAYRIE